MIDGGFAEQTFMHPIHGIKPGFPQETSGIGMGAQAIYRYALKESDYPILTIVDKIGDVEGNTIPPGHYELALSDEKDFLILIQTRTPFAIIPTFKIEEDKSAYKKPEKKLVKIKKKIEKARKETNEKRAKVGMPPDEEKIHMEASIEYVKNGNYYLIKYERGTLRAWGAIKAD